MISVIYSPAEGSLRLSGHAMQASRGRDIVCAAASILAYTLEAGGADSRETPEGALLITGQRPAVSLIAGGYKLLAENYPQNIRFEVKQ